MMEVLPASSIPSPSRARPRALASALVPFLASLAVAIACYLSSGVSLGLFFGPILLLAFLAPPLAMAEPTLAGRLVASIAMALPIWLVWIILGGVGAFADLRVGLVLISFVLALAGCASLLDHLGLGTTFAAALTALLAIAWLTWPVWLSPWLTGPAAQRLVGWLAFAHPLLSLNGVLFKQFNFWDRYTIAYQQLTTLNQDMLYALPRSVFWTFAIHCGFGGLMLMSAQRSPRSSERKAITVTPQPSETPLIPASASQ
ncbi:MAG TPA: hypothetical protein VFC78_17680 [Tepidisphaeraceae bacterium]|nr:hypothetical protein [Tepidisphaeraceae bacterium]